MINIKALIAKKKKNTCDYFVKSSKIELYRYINVAVYKN